MYTLNCADIEHQHSKEIQTKIRTKITKKQVHVEKCYTKQPMGYFLDLFRQKWRHQWHCRHLNKNLKLTFFSLFISRHVISLHIDVQWLQCFCICSLKIMIDWLIADDTKTEYFSHADGSIRWTSLATANRNSSRFYTLKVVRRTNYSLRLSAFLLQAVSYSN